MKNESRDTMVANVLVDSPLPPHVERSRNLVRFCRHMPHEQLHDWFVADFGFRSELSRFSFLKNYGSLPGPDEAFSHLQQDARPLFEKLLGMEMEYPGTPYLLQPYSSMNYYRSHIEEVFHHTGPQHRPFPPVEGRCVMFFAATDVLRVEFTLTNKSAAEVAVKVRWFSRPSAGLSHTLELLPDGFRHACVQKVMREYEASAVVRGASFKVPDPASRIPDPGSQIPDPGSRIPDPGEEIALRTDWEAVTLAARETRKWVFEVRFNGAAGPVGTLAQAIDNVEARYAALPELPAEWSHFEPLVLRAAGIVLNNRFLETDPKGNRVPTLHGGKCGVEAAWFWDSCTSLLGAGLMKDAATGWGTYRLFADGIAADGKPFVRYCDGEYVCGVQNPILAWGVWNFYALCPDREQLAYCYPAVKRYVEWWLRKWDLRGEGLYVYASGMGCTGLDDALQWCEKFPIALQPGEAWHSKEWGHSRPDQFESVDTNCQLYLEMKALALMARELGLTHDAAEWDRQADALGKKIHEYLFNPEAGVYQARSIVDGRFNGMVSLESFLPIYAGITPQPLAQQICREFLLNPDRFYTTLPFPTLDRSNEAFRSSGSLYQPPAYPGALVQQAYWIGRTWLNYDYWMVGALNQAGLVKEADAAAEKILDAVSRSESIYECYDPLTGTGTGHAEFPWGAASTLALAFRLYRHGPLQGLINIP